MNNRTIVWSVESFNIDSFGRMKNLNFSCFSSETKAKAQIDWLKECAINNGAVIVSNHDNRIQFKTTRHEFFVIELIRSVLDEND